MPEDTIHCDIIDGTIEYLKAGKAIELNAERNAYQMEEIKHFFAIADCEEESDNDIHHAYKVLKLSKGII
jgi:hypothetical protein